MASQTRDQTNLKLKATQEDLQVMVNYAKGLLEENKALRNLLRTVVVPFEEDLETLKHLSEFSHEIPSLKTSATEQDQRPKDSRPWEYQLSPKIAARMSFWLEAISSSDDNLKTILKEKMELKEEVMCLMDEVEVLKVALRKAGSELNSLKSGRANGEEGTNRGQMTGRGEGTTRKDGTSRGEGTSRGDGTSREKIAIKIPSITTNEPSTPSSLVTNTLPPINNTSMYPDASHGTPFMINSSDSENIPSASLIRRLPEVTPSETIPHEATPPEATPPEATPIKKPVRSVSHKQSIDADNCITAVSVVDYRPQESQSGHMYVIHVTWIDGNIYEVYRRYGEFFTFCNVLEQLLETESSPRVLLPLPVMGSQGPSERSVKAHLDSITTFCEVVALQMDSRVSKPSHVTDFFKAYPRDKNLGCVSARSTSPVPSISSVSARSTSTVPSISSVSARSTSPAPLQNNASRSEPAATKDQTAELSTPLSVANGDTSQVAPPPLLVATENYVADGDRKLSLFQGDIVTVIEMCEDGWWLVSKGNMIGWVPSTYLESNNATQEKTPKEGLKRRPPIGEYIAERPHTALSGDELSFAKDSVLHIMEKSLNGWWLARHDGMVGLVPASLLVKKLGKKVPRKTCVTLRSNFGHTISGISEPPPRRLLMSSRGEANSEEHNCNGGEDEDGGRGAETN